MKERGLIDAIHRQLPPALFKQGMTGAAFTGNGIPDYYYDGPNGDLWIEYKQFDHMPRDGIVCCAPVPNTKKQPKGHLTEQQLAWLLRRYHNARVPNAIVVAGLPDTTVVMLLTPQEWLVGTKIELAFPRKGVARWITSFCGA